MKMRLPDGVGIRTVVRFQQQPTSKADLQVVRPVCSADKDAGVLGKIARVSGVIKQDIT